MPTCEHGLRSTECYTCASPKHGAFVQDQRKPEPVQEPVAYVHRQGNHWEVSERHLDSDEKARGWTEEPLYTAPPQRKPLTDEEIKRIDNSTHFHESSDWSLRFARAIERAHGIGVQE